MFQPTTIHDVRDALNALLSIRRPEGDNEGEPINDPSVYDLLSPSDQDCVDHAYSTVRSYVLHGDDEVNNRAVTTIRNSGYQINIGPDQYDPMRIAGSVTVGEWTLLIGD